MKSIVGVAIGEVMDLRHTRCLCNFPKKKEKRKRKRKVYLVLFITIYLSQHYWILSYKVITAKAQGHIGKLPIKHGQFVSNASVQQTCLCRYVPFTMIYQYSFYLVLCLLVARLIDETIRLFWQQHPDHFIYHLIKCTKFFEVMNVLI